MKSKLFITMALFAITFAANAQTEKGKNLIGGSINFLSAKFEDAISKSKNTQFTVGPKYGYFFSKNFVVGLQGSVSYSKVTSSYIRNTIINGYPSEELIEQSNKNQDVTIGPFVRYYVDITEKFKFFGQFNANIGFGKEEQINAYAPIEFKTNVFGASVTPSFAFFPTKKIALELGFGLISYNHTSSKRDDENSEKAKGNAFSFGFDAINPNLGFSLHF